MIIREVHVAAYLRTIGYHLGAVQYDGSTGRCLFDIRGSTADIEADVAAMRQGGVAPAQELIDNLAWLRNLIRLKTPKSA